MFYFYPRAGGDSKIKLCGQIAVYIPANGLFHEFLSHTKVIGQSLDVLASIRHGLIQLLYRDQLPDRPFIGAVLVLFSDIVAGVGVVKTA